MLRPALPGGHSQRIKFRFRAKGKEGERMNSMAAIFSRRFACVGKRQARCAGWQSPALLPVITGFRCMNFICIFACAKMVCRPASAVRPNHVIAA
jgi:hypothetical protein